MEQKEHKDYIERDAALNIAFEWCPDDDGSVGKTGDLRDMLDEIEAIPAADVRPVVLCGECKFWGRERISCEGLARCNTGETGVRYRNRNDFCSRGEKREEP